MDAGWAGEEGPRVWARGPSACHGPGPGDRPPATAGGPGTVRMPRPGAQRVAAVGEAPEEGRGHTREPVCHANPGDRFS